ncbi:hypothetical protein [Flavobacterium sp.]|uniref:hypothetical protein n=1 Tax=Flavobacterium sp. TaxID=239 RepID=UPI0032675E73
MRNYIGSFLLFFCVVFASYSQTKTIEKGTYLSTNKGQKIKLNLLKDNKYELVFYSGNYEIKGDSLLFTQNTNKGNAFDLSFKNDKKAKKIKVNFVDPSYYSFYIGTQKGTEAVQYQRLSDIKENVNPDGDKVDVEFEIDRADFVYLVFEQYGGDSKLSKFALPKDVSEITVKYRLDALGDLNISGFFDNKTNELLVSEQSGKNPLVFRNEKNLQPEKISNVVALEDKTISNWTYPGKEPLVSDDFGYQAVDSIAAAADSVYYPSAKFDFKFKIENNLKSALNATKITKNKFLVILADTKNPSAKADFDSFLKDKETEIGYIMYDTYLPEYDIFNYYLATAEDKKWLKANKIADDQTVIILNNDGEVLASSKSALSNLKPEFDYYFAKRVQKVNTLYSFNKVIKDKKATDANLIFAFNNAAVNELPYDDDQSDDVNNDEKSTSLKFVKVTLDKKEVSQTWKKLIEAHQKDTKPNKYLAETILKEIKNQGFNKQLFNEERVLNDTDFLAIDYLLKHYDAIEKMNIEDENGHAIVLFKGNLSAEIASSLQQNAYIADENLSGNTIQSKTIAVYKKLIAAGKGNYDCYKNYLDYLSLQSEKSPDDITFLKEFNSYFNSYLSTDKGNAIETLDEMFSANNNSDWNYDGWSPFKEYHSNLANTAAWAVVQKLSNSNFIKDAIGWSEYSLIVTKNNPYYLDTLAQLYYKDGQKEKAIQTQTLAVKFLSNEVEQQTAFEIRETLTKMENGTY